MRFKPLSTSFRSVFRARININSHLIRIDFTFFYVKVSFALGICVFALSSMTSDTSRVTPQNLKDILSSLHAHTPTWCFNTDNAPFSGKQAHVYVVEYPDASQWAIRVPVHASHLGPEGLADTVNGEVSILKKLQTVGFKWSPRLIAFDSGFDNAIRFFYVALTWIPGKPLQWTDEIPARREDRNKVIRQMLQMTTDLAHATISENAESGYEHLVAMIDRQICRVINGQLPSLTLRNCLLHRALARRAIDPAIDSHQFIISHNDLAPENIVDENYNITGIIDWGFARKLPLQFGLTYPRFLNIEPPWDINKDPPPTDMRAFLATFFTPCTSLEQDRAYAMTLLSAQSKDPMILRFCQFVSSPHLDWRRLIFEAATSKVLNSWMANRSWLLQDDDAAWLKLQSSAAIEETTTAFLQSKAALSAGIDRKTLEESLKKIQFTLRLIDLVRLSTSGILS